MLQLFTYVFDNSALINGPMILLAKHGRSRLVIEVMRRLLLEIVLVLMNRQDHLASATESLELWLELHLLLHSIPAE
jgi:hypothetical protein